MVCAGRRGGKTTGAAGLAVEGLTEKLKRVLYAVPTGDQITRFWHEVVQALAEPIENGYLKKYESDKIIEKPGTEQRIRAKTAWNADSLRGDYGDLIILDEYQLMNEDALNTVVYPMLIDNNGDLVLIYTPPSLHSRSASKATDKQHAAKLWKKNLTDPKWLCLHFTSHDNPHVSKEGIAEVSQDMTELSRRQEIEAENIEEVPGALWKHQMFDDHRVNEAPPLVRIVIGVDPSGGSTNEVGLIAAGRGADGHGYVIADDSMLAASPRNWAERITFRYYELKADRVVGEENFGGDMVKTVITMFDANMSYRGVDAARGKIVRAEPISALYARGQCHHVGPKEAFEKLEEECCTYVPGDPKSPNRMDALVWAMWELFPQNQHFAVVESVKEAVEKIEKTTLQKPATHKDTSRCPYCESTAIVKRGPIMHCNQCGREWGGFAPNSENPQPRGDLFK